MRIKDMRISQVIWETTERRYMTWGRVWQEVQELVEGVWARDWDNVKEELSDVALFIQIALFWKLTLDQQIWGVAVPAAEKFAARHLVWSQIYEAAGLPKNLATTGANYLRVHKVIKRVVKMGGTEEGALKAYQTVVIPLQK